jgi:hypothetical protein
VVVTSDENGWSGRMQMGGQVCAIPQHQMNPQLGQQRIRRTTTFTLWIMRLDQGNQTLPRHNLIHLNQETLAAGLLTFVGILGIGEGHLFHRGSTVQFV